ncbi:GntR family transcriptional regulator [Limnoglobus roseus]|uniref:GntR family transcriptional regulator n=1 Tax=Limnoglobus roseus TaxID=2598579 RepID=A0A5C1ALG4_9BACT|nr:GntR family transcriptional regulator [Limnoglobus roseus]QEL19790.1 GntR family transcriptional regulator [Limnoglobus roseus]
MPIQTLSVRDHVRRTITERILAGVYQPGDRLIELQIARELGTSQGSVREALRELEASRIVETAPHRGTRVRTVSPQEMRESYLVRGLLEEAAAPMAAKAFKGNAEQLWNECDTIIACAERGELSEQAAHNAAFHRMIVAASGNGVLLRLWDTLAFETRTRVQLSRPKADPVGDAKTHRPIAKALENGDGKLAGRLLREHAEFFAPPADAPQSESA